ncbi:uncharacterized protein EI97DRAFT_446736 [Westerdykella ornata]|uniref:SnoaL-like domain-containing protein n=1 Tax=Westerdykella ornata TaxID=318751 RepID=A0A6A6J539_WESOR|nr:uncharacterized protein EI97DRAFT_446736 [Westerdykella ornata]KAF2271297.1 hypothetical protein EI97DRAFT_446736 [Westerdykella ornata]
MSYLASTYRAWLDCISQREWNKLTSYMHSSYDYNGKQFTPTEFAGWVEKEGCRFSDYRITVDTILVDDVAQCIGCRIFGKGRPADSMFGCSPTEKDIYFVEHHLVWFTQSKIAKTLYILDIGSIHQQFQSTERYMPDLISEFLAPSAKVLSTCELEKAIRRFFSSISTRTMASELPEIVQSELWRDGVKMPLDVYLGLIEKSIAVMPDV